MKTARPEGATTVTTERLLRRASGYRSGSLIEYRKVVQKYEHGGFEKKVILKLLNLIRSEVIVVGLPKMAIHSSKRARTTVWDLMSGIGIGWGQRVLQSMIMRQCWKLCESGRLITSTWIWLKRPFGVAKLPIRARLPRFACRVYTAWLNGGHLYGLLTRRNVAYFAWLLLGC